LKKKRKFVNKTNLPDHEIRALARCFLPYIREFYATEEGRREFEEWEREQEEKTKLQATTETEKSQ
jgi:hypothetical protein